MEFDCHVHLDLDADLTRVSWAATGPKEAPVMQWFRYLPARVHERLLFGADAVVGHGPAPVARQRKNTLALLRFGRVKKSLLPDIMGGTMHRLLGMEA